MPIFFIPMTMYAHPGGHFQKSDEELLNTWQLKDGSYVKGNFSKGDDHFVYLEQLEGKTIAIPLNELTSQDQALASFKIRRSQKMNEVYNLPLKNSPKFEDYLPNSMKMMVFLFLTILIVLAYKIFPRLSFFHQNRYQLTFTIIIGLASIYACKKAAISGGNNSSGTSTTVTIPKTFISFLDSAFAPFKPLVSTNSDPNYYYVSSSGFPNHNMMVGITSWQQQVPIPQTYTGSNSWSIPLQPVYATTPLSTKTHLMKGAVAIAVNGIPIFNSLNNRGEDSYLIGELDNWGGHCGRADDYHYHAAPMHLGGIAHLPIAFALDGFAVYGSKEPDGSSMMSLDTCHGHVGKNNIYHYHGTVDYPYVVGAMKGKVSLDPSTPAPEDQILPQAFAKPLRPATTPLKDAVITDFKSTSTNSYSLTYKIASKYGYVNYSWDANNKYSYTLIDTSGKSTTTSYQR